MFRRLILFSTLIPICASAQSFSFFSTLRAGRFAGADWELGVGTNSSASNSTQSFNYLQNPGNMHWGSSSVNHDFQIGWTAATNTAYVTVWNANGAPTTASFTNAGVPLAANANWTLPVNSLFVSASAQNNATSISLNNLTLSSGVQVLSGSLSPTLTASQSGAGFSASNSAPLILNAASNGGNWYLSGTVRFSGLASQGGSAQGSQLQFMVNALGSDVPEAGTMSMIGIGLVAFTVLRRRSRKGESRA